MKKMMIPIRTPSRLILISHGVRQKGKLAEQKTVVKFVNMPVIVWLTGWLTVWTSLHS